MTRSLLLALALARAAALLDSPGLRGTISEAAEPAGQYSVRSKGRKLDFGYQDFFVGPLDDPFNDAMKAKGYVCDNTKDKVEQEIAADALPPLAGARATRPTTIRAATTSASKWATPTTSAGT